MVPGNVFSIPEFSFNQPKEKPVMLGEEDT
jgi:hypothetical protein